MSKVNCEVIKDLLPLYVEDLASDSTRSLVEEHIATCSQCQQEKISLCTEMPMPQNTDTKAMESIKTKLFRKKVSTICGSVLTMILIFVLIALNVNAPIVLPYEKVEESICVIKNESGELVIDIKEPALEVDIEYGMAENGIYTADVSCYTTKWKQKFEKTSGENRVVSLVGKQPIQSVNYYPTTSGENRCLYKEEPLGSTSAGCVTLPRLVLHTYVFFAILLSLIGVIVCVCFRKKKEAMYTALKVTIVPASYILSSLVILAGKGDVYNSLYYFSGILLSTLLMSMIGWCVLALVRYRKIKSANPVEKNF